MLSICGKSNIQPEPVKERNRNNSNFNITKVLWIIDILSIKIILFGIFQYCLKTVILFYIYCMAHSSFSTIIKIILKVLIVLIIVLEKVSIFSMKKLQNLNKKRFSKCFQFPHLLNMLTIYFRIMFIRQTLRLTPHV